MRLSVLLLSLAGLLNPGLSCDGILYSGQCHQEVYTDACPGVGQRLFSRQGQSEAVCDCDVSEGWIKYRGACHQHLAPSPHCEGNNILKIINSRSRYWRCVPNPCGPDFSSLPHKSDWNSSLQAPCHQVEPGLVLGQCELQLHPEDKTLTCCTPQARTDCLDDSRSLFTGRGSCGNGKIWTRYLRKCVRLING